MITEKYAEILFEQLYGDINGYQVSNSARAQEGKSESNLLYGEILFNTWKEMVEIIKPKSDGVFFDLGSGTGRVVMQSHLLFNFKKVIGVELLKGLHEKALEIKNKFDKTIKPQIEADVIGREITFGNYPLTTSKYLL